MKFIKKIVFSILIVISLIFIIVIYDLSSFDSSYLNKNSISFSKNNLNSKKVKKLFNEIEKIITHMHTVGDYRK